MQFRILKHFPQRMLCGFLKKSSIDRCEIRQLYREYCCLAYKAFVELFLRRPESLAILFRNRSSMINHHEASSRAVRSHRNPSTVFRASFVVLMYPVFVTFNNLFGTIIIKLFRLFYWYEITNDRLLVQQ